MDIRKMSYEEIEALNQLKCECSGCKAHLALEQPDLFETTWNDPTWRDGV